MVSKRAGRISQLVSAALTVTMIASPALATTGTPGSGAEGSTLIIQFNFATVGINAQLVRPVAPIEHFDSSLNLTINSPELGAYKLQFTPTDTGEISFLSFTYNNGTDSTEQDIPSDPDAVLSVTKDQCYEYNFTLSNNEDVAQDIQDLNQTAIDCTPTSTPDPSPSITPDPSPTITPEPSPSISPTPTPETPGDVGGPSDDHGPDPVITSSSSSKSSSHKTGKVLGATTAKIKKTGKGRACYLIPQIPPLFESVFHRKPTITEEAYWIYRIQKGDKISVLDLSGAMGWWQVHRNAGYDKYRELAASVLKYPCNPYGDVITFLFQKSWGKKPSTLQWNYWLKRFADGPKRRLDPIFGAMQWHFEHKKPY